MRNHSEGRDAYLLYKIHCQDLCIPREVHQLHKVFHRKAHQAPCNLSMADNQVCKDLNGKGQCLPVRLVPCSRPMDDNPWA